MRYSGHVLEAVVEKILRREMNEARQIIALDLNFLFLQTWWAVSIPRASNAMQILRRQRDP